jgi:hypothetical protein
MEDMKMKKDLTGTILKAVALAMGVATIVLGIMDQIAMQSGITLVGIGLLCLAFDRIREKQSIEL